MRKLHVCDMEEFGRLESSEKTTVSNRSRNGAPFRKGCVVNLVKRLRQATNEYAPPHVVYYIDQIVSSTEKVFESLRRYEQGGQNRLARRTPATQQ